MEDQLHLDLVKFEEELNKLKAAVEYIESAKTTTEAASKTINEMINIKKEFTKLQDKAEILIERIDKVDFPSRLDKVDSTVSTINQNISNTQSRIESIEKNISKEIDRIKLDLSNRLDKTDEKIKTVLSEIDSSHNKLMKENKTLRYISIGSLVLILITISLILFLKL